MKKILSKYNLKSLSYLALVFFISYYSLSYAQNINASNFNLVQNGSFESVIAPDYPAKWRHTKSVVGRATYRVNSSESHENSVFVTIQRNPIQGIHGLYQTNIKLRPSATYRLTFKSSSNKADSAIRVKLYDKLTKNELLSLPNTFNLTENSLTYSTEFRTPENAESINADLLFQFNGSNGTVFVLDDIVLADKALLESSASNQVRPQVARQLPRPRTTTFADITSQSVKDATCSVFVDVENGNDANSGLVSSSALKSITRGLNLVKNYPTNKVLCVNSGTYKEVVSFDDIKSTNETPIIIKSTSNVPFVISGDSYNLPLRDCIANVKSISDSCLRAPLVAVNRSSFIVLSNAQITNSSGVGLRISNSTNVLLLDSAVTENTSFGILIGSSSSGIKIQQTRVTRNFKIAQLTDVGEGAGISIYSTKPNNRISGINIDKSEIANNFGDGVFLGPNTSLVKVSNTRIYDNTKANISLLNSRDNEINSNFLYCTSALNTLRSSVKNPASSTELANLVLAGHSMAVSDNSSSKNVFTNNIAANCGRNLLVSALTGQVVGNVFTNNTFSEPSSAEIVQINSNSASFNSNVFQNNLFLQTISSTYASILDKLRSESNKFSRNLVLANQVTTSSTNPDQLNILQEMIDVSESTQSSSGVLLDPKKYAPKAGSKAVDYGIKDDTVPSNDFFGNQRSGSVDAGAIEYFETSVLGVSITSATDLSAIPVSECKKYVDPAGDNTTGTTLQTAYTTIQKGVDSIVAGDVLCIKGGIYKESVTISKQYSDAEKVKIGAFSAGGAAILGSTDSKLPAAVCMGLSNKNKSRSEIQDLLKTCNRKALINIETAQNIELVGLIINESTANGVYIFQSNKITLNNIKAYNNGLAGVALNGSQDVQITKAQVFENVSHRIATKDINSAGLLTSQESENINIRDSIIYKNYGDGVSMQNSDELELHDTALWDNLSSNIESKQSNKLVINRTLVTCTRDGLSSLKSKIGASTDYGLGISYYGITSNSSDSNTIVNSIVSGCKTNLLLNGDGDRRIKKLSVFNNHFINARTSTSTKDTTRNVLLLGTNFPDIQFMNNIIWQKDSSIRTIVGYSTQYDFKSNILYPNTIRTLTSPAFLVIDPKLDDPDKDISTSNLEVGKLMPSKTSPVINTAYSRISSDYLSVDYLKKDRNNLDIGALEVQGVSDDDQDLDADDDGVLDADDQCPRVPKGSTPDPTKPGCPLNVTDNDEDDDGVVDDDDECPLVAAGSDPDPDRPGCPLEEDPTDSDNDGIVDSEDYCPDEPKGSNPDPDYPGCPNGSYEDDYCTYFWCDDEDSNDAGSEDDSNEYDPYEDYYYDLGYEDSDSAQFGLVDPAQSGEVLKNGSFDLAKEANGLPVGWFIRTGVDGAVKINLVPNDYLTELGNALKVQLKKLPSVGRVELFQNGINLKPGSTYLISFVAKSDYGSDVDLSLNNAVFPFEVLTNELYGVDLKPDWKEFTGFIKIPETQNPESAIRLVISFDGAIDDTFWIDKISLTEDMPEVDTPPEDDFGLFKESDPRTNSLPVQNQEAAQQGSSMENGNSDFMTDF